MRTLKPALRYEGFVRRSQVLSVASIVLISIAYASCVDPANKTSMPAHSSNDSGGSASVLLFNGSGTSLNDVVAVEAILDANNLSYSTVNSSQLNEMSEKQIGRYRLLIVPGGDFVKMGNSLNTRATANVSNAVQNGLNYVGICGGGFLAGHFGPGYNSFNLTSGVQFTFYSGEGRGIHTFYHLFGRDIHKGAVPIAAPGGQTLEQYWEDGPQLTGWGVVIGKYPDGSSAIVEGKFGDGWVILSGVHPEAPAEWRHGINFNTPASVDNAYAGELIRAALNRVTLPHY